MHTHIYIYTTNTNPSERDGITKEEKVWRKGGQRTEGGWSQPWRQLVTGYQSAVSLAAVNENNSLGVTLPQCLDSCQAVSCLFPFFLPGCFFVHLHTHSPFASSCLSLPPLSLSLFLSFVFHPLDGRPWHYCRNLGLGGLGLALTSDVMCLLFPNEISRSLHRRSRHGTRRKVGSLTGEHGQRGRQRERESCAAGQNLLRHDSRTDSSIQLWLKPAHGTSGILSMIRSHRFKQDVIAYVWEEIS